MFKKYKKDPKKGSNEDYFLLAKFLKQDLDLNQSGALSGNNIFLNLSWFQIK